MKLRVKPVTSRHAEFACLNWFFGASDSSFTSLAKFPLKFSNSLSAAMINSLLQFASSPIHLFYSPLLFTSSPLRMPVAPKSSCTRFCVRLFVWLFSDRSEHSESVSCRSLLSASPLSTTQNLLQLESL